MQDVDTVELMKDVALYNTAVSSPLHAVIVTNRLPRGVGWARCCAHHRAEGRRP